MRAMIVCVLLTMAIGCASSRTPAQSQKFQPFFFIQMSDPQLGMRDNDKSIEQDVEAFDTAIAHANRIHPDFVVITGDLINKPGDTTQEKAFRHLLKHFDKIIPVYLVSGNHDVTNAPTTQSLSHYESTFGKDVYSFDRHNCHFIVLNSTVLWRPQKVPQEASAQMAWLREDLAKVKARKVAPAHTVIFEHHSPFLATPDEADSYFNLPKVIRSPLLELCHANGIHHIFAGHYHRCADATDGDLEVTTTGPVGKPLGKDPPGFCIAVVHENSIDHHYYPLSRIPERVDLNQPLK